MNNITKLATSITAILAITGCTPSTLSQQTPEINSIYSIDKSYEDKDASYKKIQNDVYSDISLLMTPKVGLSYFHTKNRKLSYPIGYGGKTSFYLTQTIENKDVNITTLNELKEKIDTLFMQTTNAILKNIDESNATTYKSIFLNKNNTISTEYENIAKDIKTYGLYIRTLTHTNISDNHLSIQKFLSGDKDTTSSTIKYSIYNGLKYSTLFVGSDMLSFYDDLNQTELNQEDPSAQVRLTTGILQVKDTLNFEVNNYLNIIKANLNVKLKGKENKEAILKLIALDIQNTYSKIQSASSISFTANSTYKVYHIPSLLKGENNITTIKNYVEATDSWKDENTTNWSTYRYIDVNVKDLMKWISRPSTSNN